MAVVVVIALLFSLIAIRVPIGFAAGIAGVVGLLLIGGTNSALGILQTSPFTVVSQYSLMTIPMFLLMAEFMVISGLAHELFTAARIWVGRIPVGLGVSTTVAGAIFASLSGSSTASAATFSRTALPEMVANGYDKRTASALVASVGTMAMLIPPSIAMVLYGILTETSIGKLLIAGVIPGLLVALVISVTLLIITSLNPNLAPTSQSYSLAQKVRCLSAAGPTLTLLFLVTGVIYTGIATATEASALGAFGAFLIVLLRGKLSKHVLWDALGRTASATAMIFMIVISAHILGYFLTFTQVTAEIVATVASLDVSRWIVLAALVAIYLVLGAIMDQIAILVLTLPVVFPVVSELGFDPVWFGVIVVLTVEIGLVTPPLGLNAYVVARYTGQRVETVFAGVWPYVIGLIGVITALCFFPEIATWLPSSVSN